MTDIPIRILIVEDEPQMQKFLRTCLAAEGYRIVEATKGQEGLDLARTHNPDLVLLDLGLPDMDGTEVTKGLREWSAKPIIIISARGQEDDKIRALDVGADDYLTKPFGTGELMARIRVALRRTARSGQETPDPVITVGELVMDLDKRQVFVATQRRMNHSSTERWWWATEFSAWSYVACTMRSPVWSSNSATRP